MSSVFRLTQEEFDALCSHVSTEMKQHAFPYIASISSAIGPKVGEHTGTGFYLAVREATYLLTNEHVARSIRQHPLGHTLFEDQNVVRITDPFQVQMDPFDLAVTRIENAIWDSRDNCRRALPADRLATQHAPIDCDFLFV